MKQKLLIALVIVLSLVLIAALVFVFILSSTKPEITPATPENSGIQSPSESTASTESSIHETTISDTSESVSMTPTQELPEESTLDWQPLPSNDGSSNSTDDETTDSTTGEPLLPAVTTPSPEGLPPAGENQLPWA